jgi:MFS family permease
MKIIPYLKENRSFAWLVGSALVGVFGFSILTPLTALQLAAMNVEASKIGFFSAIPWIVVLIISFLIPAWVRRLGFRPMVVAASLLGAIVIPGFLLSGKFWVWCVVNALFGLSIAIRWVLIESWVMQTSPSHEKGRFIGLYETSLALVFAVGPTFLMVTGINGPLPFLLTTILFILSCLLTLMAGSFDVSSSDSFIGQSVRNAFQGPMEKMDLILMLAGFVAGIHEVGTLSVGPVYGLKRGLPPQWASQVAALIGAGSLLAQYPIGILSDRFGVRGPLKGALLLLLVAPPLLFLVPNLFISVGGMGFVWGAVGGGLYTLSMIQMARRYQDLALIRGTSRVVFAYTLGSVIGPAIGGWSLEVQPSFGLPLILIALSLLCAIWALMTFRAQKGETFV